MNNEEFMKAYSQGSPSHKASAPKFGIEIETEGANYGSMVRPLVYWNMKEDGSLRQGIEFVCKAAFPFDKLPDVLEDFRMSTSILTFKNSIRCSTHIHYNILGWTYAEIYRAIIGWFFFENLLVNLQPKERIGNLFCLRMKDAEVPFKQLREGILEGSLPNTSQDSNKYGALNLYAIHKYGSLEFRFFEAITDMKRLHLWCKILNNLLQKMKNMESIAGFLTEIQYNKSPELIYKYLGEEIKEILKEKKVSEDDAMVFLKETRKYAYVLSTFLLKDHFLKPLIKKKVEDEFVTPVITPFKPWASEPEPEEVDLDEPFHEGDLIEEFESESDNF